MQAFNDLGFSKAILKGIRDAGYETPSPIQAAAVPPALAGRDLIGCAQTGTGKTAAFVMPMLDRLGDTRSGGKRRVRALVVTPTRELALQVEDAVRTYGKYTGLRSVAIFGGVGMQPQIRALRNGVDIVVATPGRLLDHLDRGNLDLSDVEVLVLDEADHMLDMGFINDVRKIVKAVPTDRQTLLFSATMPPPLQKLAGQILRDAELIEIGERRNPAETVEQHACLVAQKRKMDLLLHVLDTEAIDNVIVFTRTKHRADRVARKLSQVGFNAAAIHSNRSQNQRERALGAFRDGKVQVLVATDIAARGIDVEGVSHVINMNTPNPPEAYIHRIGRTGRAESQGQALTFVSRDEANYLRDIERHTKRPLARRTFDGFDMGAETEAATPSNGSAKAGGRQNGNRNGRSRNGSGNGASSNGSSRNRSRNRNRSRSNSR